MTQFETAAERDAAKRREMAALRASGLVAQPRKEGARPEMTREERIEYARWVADGRHLEAYAPLEDGQEVQRISNQRKWNDLVNGWLRKFELAVQAGGSVELRTVPSDPKSAPYTVTVGGLLKQGGQMAAAVLGLDGVVLEGMTNAEAYATMKGLRYGDHLAEMAEEAAMAEPEWRHVGRTAYRRISYTGKRNVKRAKRGPGGSRNGW